MRRAGAVGTLWGGPSATADGTGAGPDPDREPEPNSDPEPDRPPDQPGGIARLMPSLLRIAGFALALALLWLAAGRLRRAPGAASGVGCSRSACPARSPSS